MDVGWSFGWRIINEILYDCRFCGWRRVAVKERQGDVETWSFVFCEVDDETDFRYDISSKDDVIGTVVAVVENNEFYVFQLDDGAELWETNFGKRNVFLMLMYAWWR